MEEGYSCPLATSMTPAPVELIGKREETMATWTPDPSFYPSPRMAARAPAEGLAYVASFDPQRRHPDEIAVVDVDPTSASYSQVVGRVQLLSLPERAAPACRAALPRGTGAAFLAHSYFGHQARPAKAGDRESHRTERRRRAVGLHASAHCALRAGRHLCRRARQ